MAQLRHDYREFKARNTEVLVIVPNGPKTIERYVTNNPTPYPILSDKSSKVAEQYEIKTKRVTLFAFTYFRPSVFLVETTGKIVYTNYVTSYIKEPKNGEPLAILAGLRV